MGFEYKPFEGIAAAVKGLHTRPHALAVAALTLLSFGLIINNSWRATPDSALYLELGESLAHGAGYTFNGEPHTYVPPGFPAIVAASVWAFGGGFLTYRILMAVMGLLAAAAGYLFVRRLCGPDVGLLAGGLFAINHALLQNSTFTTSDVPFALFTLMSLNGVLYAAKGTDRISWTIAAGILTGLPAIIRINGWGVPPAAAIFLWYAWKQRGPGSRVIMMAVFLFAAAFPSVLWELYKASFPASFNEGTYFNAVSGRTAAMQFAIIFQSLFDYATETSYALTGVVLKTGFLEFIVPIIVIVGAGAAFLKRERLLVSLIAIQFAGLLLSLAGSRYILALIPAAYLFLALGLLLLVKGIASKLHKQGSRLLEPRLILTACFAIMAVLNVGHNVVTIVQARSPLEAGGAESTRDLPFFAAGRWLRTHAAGEVVLTMYPRVIHYLSGDLTVELVRSGVPEHQAWVESQDQIQRLITARKPSFLFSDANNKNLYQNVMKAIQTLGFKLEEIPEARVSERFRLWRIVKGP